MIFWLSALLALVAISAYAWGASGTLSIIVRHFVGFLVAEIPDLVASHPFFKVRGRWQRVNRAATWIFFGLPIAMLLTIVAVVLFLVLTPFAIIALFRRSRTGESPEEPSPPPFAPSALLAFFLTRRTKSDRSSENQNRVYRFRRRATV